MKSTDIPRIREWFTNYANSFLTGEETFDSNIRLKFEHSYRVFDCMVDIADDLGLKGRRRRIALACALLHDCGRFEQFKRYRTFSDPQSEDHGILGANIIERENILAELSESARKTIILAVRYHNAKTVPPELTAEHRYFIELTRDVDKIDIFKVTGDYYLDKDPDKDRTIVHNLPESPEITDEVFNEFIHDGHVDYNSIKTVSDFKVFQLGWVWDINHRAALRRLNDLGYADVIVSTLPETERGIAVKKKYFDFLSILEDEKHLGWTEISREKLHDCRIFTLYSSQRRSNEGATATTYMIDAPDWVTIVPLIKKDGREYFVMVRQYRHGAMKITTEFPAGTLEPDEEPETAALRELEEETGYRAGKMTWLGSVNPNPAFLTNTYTAYLAEDLVQTGTQNLDEHEYVDYELVPVGDVIERMGTLEYSNGTMLMALMYYLREAGKVIE